MGTALCAHMPHRITGHSTTTFGSTSAYQWYVGCRTAGQCTTMQTICGSMWQAMGLQLQNPLSRPTSTSRRSKTLYGLVPVFISSLVYIIYETGKKVLPHQRVYFPFTVFTGSSFKKILQIRSVTCFPLLFLTIMLLQIC